MSIVTGLIVLPRFLDYERAVCPLCGIFLRGVATAAPPLNTYLRLDGWCPPCAANHRHATTPDPSLDALLPRRRCRVATHRA